MRILLVSTDNPYVEKIGGKHVHQLLLERSLRKLGNDVDVLYPKKSNRFIRGLKEFLRDPRSIFSRIRRIIALIDIISDTFKGDFYDYDIVNAHDVVSAYKLDHPRIVLTVHGYFTRELIDYSPSLSNRLSMFKSHFLKIEKTSYEKARKIIAVDGRIKNYIVEDFSIPKEKIVVIHNAVDTDTFSPVSEDEKMMIREKLGVEKWRWIVLIPRRFVPKNGVLYAADAVDILNRDDILFIFAGRGILERELRNRVGDLKNVIIKGIPHEEIHLYYKASDVVLIPSVTSNEVEEATSLSMLEGMACGKIVICTRVGGMKEIIRDGENGFLIEQKSPEAIAEKIEYVLKNFERLKNVRAKAREYVLRNHSPVEHAKKFLNVYKEVLRS